MLEGTKSVSAMKITEKFREIKRRGKTRKRKIKDDNKAVKQSRESHKTVVSPIQRSSADCSFESPLRVLSRSQDVTITNDDLLLERWKIPSTIVEKYKEAGVASMFKWQAECLLTGNVLERGNLVYSAPTSAGKTFVSEVLMLKTILECQKKVIMILPFVSIVKEKVKYLKTIFGGESLHVDGFMGNYTPPGGLESLDLAVGTIEKINNLVNRLIENKSIEDVGMVVIDELHLIGDRSRGYLLELLLSKLQYLCHRRSNHRIQIVAMSATLPNLDVLARWLNADLYSTDFRPIPLEKFLKVGGDIYDKDRQKMRSIGMSFKDDLDGVFELCLETVLQGLSVLVFCPTKAWCESLAETLAKQIFMLGQTETTPEDPRHDSIIKLRRNINGDQLTEVINQLKTSPAGLDHTLQRCVSFGVAYHHAGLTMDEREIVETSFRCCHIKILCATTTLSSGVNLPARRVIVRSPMFHGLPIDKMTFHQMMGRAGRKGIDTHGESIVICKESEKEIGFELLKSYIPPVMSSMVTNDNRLNNTMKRALLELIVNGLVVNLEDIEAYSDFTLVSKCSSEGILRHQPILQCLTYLLENNFVRKQKQDDGVVSYTPTQLGMAALASGLSPDDSLEIFSELNHARMNFALDTDLHIIYQIVPPNVSRQLPGIDWLNFLTCLESLDDSNKRVAKLVGVQETFIIKAMKGNINSKNEQSVRDLAVHQRFFVALALNDLVNEVPLGRVATKYGCNRGLLQNLQQSAASFAGMVTVFCKKLGWSNLEILIHQFQPRLYFGVNRELCDLVQIPSLNGQWARVLYSAGITTLTDLANSSRVAVENILCNGRPFERSSGHILRSKLIFLSNDEPGLDPRLAADLLIKSARDYIQAGLGKNIIWQDSSSPVEQSVEHVPALRTDTSNTETDVAVSSPCPPDTPPEELCSLPSQSTGHAQIIVEDEPTQEGTIRLFISSSSSPDRHSDSPSLISPTQSDVLATSHSDVNNETTFFINTQQYNDLMREPILLQPSELGLEPLSEIRETEEDDCDDLFQLSNPELDLLTSEVTHVRCESRLSDSVGGSDKSNNSETDIFADSSWFATGKTAYVTPVVNRLVDSLHPSNMLTPEGPVQRPVPGSSLSTSVLENLVNCGDDFSMQCDRLDSEVRLRRSRLSDVLDMNNRSSTPCRPSVTRLKDRLVVPEPEKSFLSRYLETPLGDAPRELEDRLVVNDSDDDSQEESVFDTSVDLGRPRDDPKDGFSSWRPEAEPSRIYPEKEVAPHLSWLSVVDPSSSDTVWGRFKKEWFDVTHFSLSLISWSHHPSTGVLVPKKNSPIGLARRQSARKKSPSETANVNTEIQEPRALRAYAVSWGLLVYYVDCEDNQIEQPRAPSIEERLSLLKSRLECTKSCVINLCPIRKQYRLIVDELHIFPNLKHHFRDPIVGHWLLDSDSNYDLASLAHKYLTQSHPMRKFLARFPNYQRCVSGARSLGVVQVSLVNLLMDIIAKKLTREKLMATFTQREMPANLVLSTMESRGIGFNLSTCDHLASRLLLLKERLEAAIHSIAGYTVPLGSTKAVRELLYCKLGLTSAKFAEVSRNTGTIKVIAGDTKVTSSGVVNVNKNKKYFPTNKAALKRLAGDHVVPRLLLEWRKIASGLSMVVSPLKRENKFTLDLGKHGSMLRLPTTYSSHHATGRVTMHEPNIQNIPRDICVTLPGDSEPHVISFRAMFVPPKGSTMMAADYKQLELRILAHLSKDSDLIRCLKSPRDIFCDIASKWLNIPLDSVSDEQRQMAKQITYGIIYGMGTKTLAEHLRVSEREAETYKADFNNKFPGVQCFIDKTVEDCKQKGYIETLGRRRRYLSNINSEHKSLQGQAIRQAVNSVVQGSAADIVKEATKNIWFELAQKGPSGGTLQPNIVLHLHDELIFEVPENDLTEVIRVVRRCMESSFNGQLSVPLPVKVRTGTSWGDLAETSVGEEGCL